eukprot:gene3156-3999_t
MVLSLMLADTGGMFAPVPDFLKSLSRLSCLKWGFEGCLAAEFRGLTFERDYEALMPSAAEASSSRERAGKGKTSAFAFGQPQQMVDKEIEIAKRNAAESMCLRTGADVLHKMGLQGQTPLKSRLAATFPEESGAQCLHARTLRRWVWAARAQCGIIGVNMVLMYIFLRRQVRTGSGGNGGPQAMRADVHAPVLPLEGHTRPGGTTATIPTLHVESSGEVASISALGAARSVSKDDDDDAGCGRRSPGLMGSPGAPDEDVDPVEAGDCGPHSAFGSNISTPRQEDGGDADTQPLAGQAVRAAPGAEAQPPKINEDPNGASMAADRDLSPQQAKMFWSEMERKSKQREAGSATSSEQVAFWPQVETKAKEGDADIASTSEEMAFWPELDSKAKPKEASSEQMAEQGRAPDSWSGYESPRFRSNDSRPSSPSCSISSLTESMTSVDSSTVSLSSFSLRRSHSSLRSGRDRRFAVGS